MQKLFVDFIFMGFLENFYVISKKILSDPYGSLSALRFNLKTNNKLKIQN